MSRLTHAPSDPPPASSANLPDRDDAVFLALAAQQGACLITGDIADLPRTLRGRVEVVTAADYVVWLESVNAG